MENAEGGSFTPFLPGGLGFHLLNNHYNTHPRLFMRRPRARWLRLTDTETEVQSSSVTCPGSPSFWQGGVARSFSPPSDAVMGAVNSGSQTGQEP